MSKSELSRRLEVTPRTITTYESKGAPESAAADLALALTCKPEFFHLPATVPPEEDRIFFRARRRSTAAQKHAATAAGRIGTELYGFITDHFGLPEVTVPDLAHADPKSAAQQLRAEWGLGIDPIPNAIHLAESQGLRVLSLPAGSENVDAFSLWDESRPYIFLSTLKSAERSRFDIAHELGHMVMHGGLGASDPAERDAEKEANRFASEFLMPEIALRATPGREPSVARILREKSALGVSAMALAYALHQAGLLTDWTYRQTCVELSKRGYRTGEPEGMDRETSRVFSVVFPALRRSKGWTTEDVASRLGVEAADIHGLTFGQAVVGIRTNPAHRAPRSRTRSRSAASLSVLG